jgi:two-component system, OmpR family, sensor histidine kinase CiaH
MDDGSRKKFRRTTVIYWMLLVYIIAALVWWFISLNQQNDEKKDLALANLHYTVDSSASPALFQSHYQKINRAHKRNLSKYYGEGSIFFLLILVGAGFIYRSVRRQIYIQQQQQNFMMAVTHELKTPISVAKLNLETLQKYNLDPERQKRLIRNTLDEAARLNFLTNNILISSQLEGGGYKSSNEELNLSDLLRDCINDSRKRFSDREFREDIEQDAEVKGDPLLLQIMINNLLENAIKYSARECPVTAKLEKHGSKIELQILDEGPGIPAVERQKIFSKFYRIGNESTRKAQGTGLGLYLCKKIARDHNADISVTNNEPHGSKFVVVFKTYA